MTHLVGAKIVDKIFETKYIYLISNPRVSRHLIRNMDLLRRQRKGLNITESSRSENCGQSEEAQTDVLVPSSEQSQNITDDLNHPSELKHESDADEIRSEEVSRSNPEEEGKNPE